MSEMETPAPPAPEPPPDETPAWTGPSQDEWEQTQQQLSQYAEVLQSQQPQQQEQGPIPPDPWERPETYQQDLEAFVDAKLAFVQRLQQEMEYQQGQEAAMETFDRLAASGGAFDKEMAWAVARELAAQAGPQLNDRTGDQIMAKAAAQVRDYEKRVGEDAVKAYNEQMQTLAGGQRRLPANPNGAAQTVPAGGYGNVPNSVEDRFFGSRS